MAAPASTAWREGYGVVRHRPETIETVENLVARHWMSGALADPHAALALCAAADRLASAAMWQVAHMTYAHRVDLSGAELPTESFKTQPEGHMGGSLNAAIAFVGYHLANALSGHTRAWVLGQGHCVAAIEAVNALLEDLSPAQQGRYGRNQAGLSQLAADFYAYAMTPDGRPAAPLGSHVNPHTAGGIMEGGYLGFAETQYIHMPLRGERVVAFLSDGAFEEQRGSDWSPRWWRAEDCGLVVPVMVLNGRRIEQRTEIGQEGGADWLAAHLRLSGFDPVIIDGHDPLAYACAILDAEAALSRFASLPERAYPARLPYVIARCVKGYGFPGAGSNRAHNLPLAGNPRFDADARREFNAGVRALYVSPVELDAAARAFAVHAAQARPRESQHVLATRSIAAPRIPAPRWEARVGESCAMEALDAHFVEVVGANPAVRVRIGNPDELKSNHMGRTLDLLRHRVNAPEPNAPEAVDGAIITALNEEAVIGAALGNKGGINLAVSYEAFAMKMLGALRQEIIFARRQREIGREPGWISVPLIATSHTWENSKNEQSHQDPTLPEALLGEMADVSRVVFPIDVNSAVAALSSVYQSKGQIACLVTPKRPQPNRFSGPEAERAVKQGAALIAGGADIGDVQLVAIGAYQTAEALAAHARLSERSIQSSVSVILEPGRFRAPRDGIERAYCVADAALSALFPAKAVRVVLTHTRPEPMLGLLRRLDGGPSHTRALGYINRGGTLDVFGMLFANRSTWAHAVEAAGAMLDAERGALLSAEEIAALDGEGDPLVLKRH
ncbi:MAG TPA: xylulose 5-phosphate 3-epimerase [Caulobacterales bacterium]|nr:xylulose 5-phosphate 3-epimerase [Caulobacterales bacterium]